MKKKKFVKLKKVRDSSLSVSDKSITQQESPLMIPLLSLYSPHIST